MQNDTTGTRQVETDAKNDGTLMSCTCQLILKIFKKYVLINSLSYKKIGAHRWIELAKLHRTRSLHEASANDTLSYSRVLAKNMKSDDNHQEHVPKKS
jgi:hypothetical protein